MELFQIPLESLYIANPRRAKRKRLIKSQRNVSICVINKRLALFPQQSCIVAIRVIYYNLLILIHVVDWVDHIIPFILCEWHTYDWIFVCNTHIFLIAKKIHLNIICCRDNWLCLSQNLNIVTIFNDLIHVIICQTIYFTRLLLNLS